VETIELLSGGLYSEVPVVTITGGGGYGATADLTFDGSVTSIDIVADTNGLVGGAGYVTVPEIQILGGNPTVPAVAIATIADGKISSVTIPFDKKSTVTGASASGSVSTSPDWKVTNIFNDKS